MRYANEFEDPDFMVEELVRNGVATRLGDFLRRFELEDCVQQSRERSEVRGQRPDDRDGYMEIDY